MAETLGSLCDKLTIVKLKQWHSEDAARLQSLGLQEQQLCAAVLNLQRSECIDRIDRRLKDTIESRPRS
jgi:hypothetical protein